MSNDNEIYRAGRFFVREYENGYEVVEEVPAHNKVLSVTTKDFPNAVQSAIKYATMKDKKS